MHVQATFQWMNMGKKSHVDLLAVAAKNGSAVKSRLPHKMSQQKQKNRWKALQCKVIIYIVTYVYVHTYMNKDYEGMRSKLY